MTPPYALIGACFTERRVLALYVGMYESSTVPSDSDLSLLCTYLPIAHVEISPSEKS
jgi:hypothetical protein